jgi:hypothetical protein
MQTHKHHRKEHGSLAEAQFRRAVDAIKIAMRMWTADTDVSFAKHVAETAADEFIAELESRID